MAKPAEVRALNTGKPATDPCGLFCTIYDVEAWSQTLDTIREDVSAARRAMEVPGTSNKPVLKDERYTPLWTKMYAWEWATDWAWGTFGTVGFADWWDIAKSEDDYRGQVTGMARESQAGASLLEQARNMLGDDAPVSSGFYEYTQARGRQWTWKDYLKLGVVTTVAYVVWDATGMKKRAQGG